VLGDRRIVCAFNLTRERAGIGLSWPADSAQQIAALECGHARIEDRVLMLDPLSAHVAVV
jgi:hypothetical protein